MDFVCLRVSHNPRVINKISEEERRNAKLLAV